MDYIGTIIQKDNIDDNLYAEIAMWCNESQEAYIDDKGTYFEVVAIPNELEADKIRREIASLQQWLSSHDYIGIKIATGRATADEYASEIDEMKEKADRINELERELEALRG